MFIRLDPWLCVTAFRQVCLFLPRISSKRRTPLTSQKVTFFCSHSYQYLYVSAIHLLFPWIQSRISSNKKKEWLPWLFSRFTPGATRRLQYSVNELTTTLQSLACSKTDHDWMGLKWFDLLSNLRFPFIIDGLDLPSQASCWTNPACFWFKSHATGIFHRRRSALHVPGVVCQTGQDYILTILRNVCCLYSRWFRTTRNI